MSRLSRADLELLLNAARTLGEQRTLDAFPQAVISALRSVVPGISYAFNEIDLERGLVTGIMDPLDSMPAPRLISVMESLITQHPLLYGLDPRQARDAHMISDFLGEHAYHRLEIYGDFYRYLETEDQMAVQFQSSSSRIVGLVVNRDGRTFSERDRDMLDRLRDHVINAYRNAEALTLLRDSATIGNRQAVWIGPGPQMRFSTARAQALMDDYLGIGRVPGTGLPELIVDWVRDLELPPGGRSPEPQAPLRLQCPSGSLTVRFLPGDQGGDGLLLLVEQRSSLSFDVLASLGLSPRQVDVVRWVVKGKTSGEIAALLGINVRTIEKHLERIYARLDVSTRAALVARVLQANDDWPKS